MRATLICIFFLLMSSFAFAQTHIKTSTAVLTWNSNTEADMSEYIILMGTVAGAYSKTKSVIHVSGVQTQTGEFTGLLEGQRYFFAVKACDLAGNCSAPSTEVSGRVLIPPGVPSGLGVRIQINITVDVP